MNENANRELIKKLSHTRENLNVLQGILADEKWKLEQKIRLINEAIENVDDVLFELTGDEFYRKNNIGGG